MALTYSIYLASMALVCGAILFPLWRTLLTLTPMQRTAAVLLSCWAANTAFVEATGVYDPWYWYIVTDSLAAMAILYQPAFRQQALIGALYMAQIVVHLIYGSLVATGPQPNADYYWQVLVSIALVQITVLGGWFGGSWRRVASRVLRLRGAYAARQNGT